MAKKSKFSQKTRHARRLYGVLASLIALSALGMEGCSWDDNAFKDFVTQNGENYTVTKCPNTEDTQKSLSYIEYVAENGVTECHYNDCRKQDECCGIDDEILRRQFIEGFKYNLCPANYRCDYDNETTEYFCTSQKERLCDTGEEKCGNKCYNLNTTEKHCGACNYECSPEALDAEVNAEDPMTEKAQCEKGVCLATECKKGYHRKLVDIIKGNGEPAQAQRCVSDDAESCNGIDCTILAGCNGNGGNCDCNEENLCIATKCALGYHTSKIKGVPCAADTDIACGADITDCTDNTLWNDESVGSKYCYKGQCVVGSCNTNFHFNEDNTKCEIDTENQCGSYNNDCTLLAGWATGKCIDGLCQANTCKSGYHNYNNYCEYNNETNCGEHGKECRYDNVEFHGGVSRVQCESDNDTATCRIKDCSTGFYRLYDSDGNIIECEENTFEHCGGENVTCHKDGVSKGICLSANVCQATDCETGYHLFEEEPGRAKCELDTILNCGKHDNKCNDEASGTKDLPFCILNNSDESTEYSCQNVCLPPLTNCDNGECVDIESNVSHCGGCNIDCYNEIPNAIVYCQNKSCLIQSCNPDYHLNNNKCEKDTPTACGTEAINCTTEYQRPHAVPACTDGRCTFNCQSGWGDCDGQLNNGCEIDLNYYGLQYIDHGQCVCQSQYSGCGFIDSSAGTRIPFCLKQGHYYKNYSRESSATDNQCKSAWSSNTWINYTKYCFDCHDNNSNDCMKGINSGQLLSIHYGSDHSYIKLNDTWDSTVYEWNEAHCINACNTGWGHRFDSNNGQESWGHTCSPKQECDMFDSVEIYWGNGKRYIDYGCNY